MEEKELNKILKKENDKKIKIKTKENIKNKEKNKSNDIIIIYKIFSSCITT